MFKNWNGEPCIRVRLVMPIISSCITAYISAYKMSQSTQSVQVFGRKKTATAVAFCKRGNGMIRINGQPLALLQPAGLKMKVWKKLLPLQVVMEGNHSRSTILFY